jgi:hypothetical protein
MLVAEMLSKNDNLTHLDIGNPPPPPLLLHPRLRHVLTTPHIVIYFSKPGNVEMGTESIIALMTVLQSNRSLVHLNIENPRIVKQLQVGLG